MLLRFNSIGQCITHYYFVPRIFAPCGISETILYFYSALYGGQERGIAHRLIDFVNGVGTAVHHSSSALCLGMLVVHAVPPSRDIVASITPLLMQ